MMRLDTRYRTVERVWFTPDGRSVVAQTGERGYLRWDLSEPGWRDELAGPPPHCTGASALDLSMTAETEYDVYHATAVVLRRGPEPAWRADGLSFHQLSLTFSPDGTRLWACGVEYDYRQSPFRVMAWDTADGRRALDVEAPAAFDWVLPSPDGRLVVGRPGSADELFFLTVGYEGWQRTGPLRWAHAVAWFPDGERVAVAMSDGVAVVNGFTGLVTARARGHREAAAAAAVHPHRPLILTGESTTVRLWEHTASSVAPRESFDWGVGRVTAVAVSPDGTLAACGGASGEVVVWDLEG